MATIAARAAFRSKYLDAAGLEFNSAAEKLASEWDQDRAGFEERISDRCPCGSGPGKVCRTRSGEVAETHRRRGKR